MPSTAGGFKPQYSAALDCLSQHLEADPLDPTALWLQKSLLRHCELGSDGPKRVLIVGQLTFVLHFGAMAVRGSASGELSPSAVTKYNKQGGDSQSPKYAWVSGEGVRMIVVGTGEGGGEALYKVEFLWFVRNFFSVFKDLHRYTLGCGFAHSYCAGGFAQ